MKLKELIRRFRAWQHEPYHYDAPSGKKHHCNNCGHSFQGEFCPVCGQRARIGHVTWKSVWEDFLSIWISDSRSAIPSILQLLGRPGYLIRDYITGHRKFSYSPVSMLFLLAIVLVIANFFTTTSDPTEIDLSVNGEEGLRLQWLVSSIDWLRDNPAWALLLYTAFMVVPTRMLFRYAPRYPRHTLPEGVYIQVFMSCLIALFLAAEAFIPGMEVFIFIYYIIAFRQLFGFSVVGTIWRTMMCWAASLVLAIIVVVALGFIVFRLFMEDAPVWGIVFVLAVVFAIQVLLLFLFGLFGRGRYRRAIVDVERQNPENDQ